MPNAGMLDPTYGTGGIITPSLTANAVLVQPNNDIVLAGSTTTAKGNFMSLARYTPSGTLDTTFGSGGNEVSNVAGGAGAAALYPAGSAYAGEIVEAVGSAVVRFNTNATIDTSFGKSGVATLPWSGTVASLVIQANGEVVVSGTVGTTTVDVSRLNVNGSIDTTFGTKGTWSESQNSNSLEKNPHSGYMALEANGEFVVERIMGALTPGSGWDMVELGTNGTIDKTFEGTFTTFAAEYDLPNGIANIDGLAVYPSTGPDTADYGKILAFGYTHTLASQQQALATVLVRYNSNGTLDSTFGNSGEVITPGVGKPTGIAMQSNGQIIVVGVTTLQRYNTNGTLDSTFGNGGIVQGQSSSVAVAIQPDGRIVTANARYLASEAEIGSFTASPNPIAVGSNTTMTVSNIADGNPNSTITQVAIYIDSNGSETLLGYVTQSSPGVWTYNFSTAGLTSGSYTLSAQAEDSYGVFGDPTALTLEVQ